MRGKISRLFAASMVPATASVLPPPERLEPPAITAPVPAPMVPTTASVLPRPERLEPPAITAPVPAPTSGMKPTPFVPGAETLTYNSVGNALNADLGTMRLSATSASFEHHQGQMALEFAGNLPAFPGYRIASEFVAGAMVYRVTNAEQYFLDNPKICAGKPLKFLVAKFESLADIQGGTMAVNVWLLSLDDIKRYRPEVYDPCGGDTYKAAKLG